jgi:hypothetical protein
LFGLTEWDEMGWNRVVWNEVPLFVCEKNKWSGVGKGLCYKLQIKLFIQSGLLYVTTPKFRLSIDIDMVMVADCIRND